MRRSLRVEQSGGVRPEACLTHHSRFWTRTVVRLPTSFANLSAGASLKRKMAVWESISGPKLDPRREFELRQSKIERGGGAAATQRPALLYVARSQARLGLIEEDWRRAQLALDGSFAAQ